MLKPLNVFSLGTVLNLKHTNCLILLFTNYLQVDMYFSMSKEAGNHDDNSHEEWQRLLDEGVKEEQQQQQPT
jgi:hypothetical protein